MTAGSERTDRARRILLVTYYYPPDQVVGAVRPGLLVEALRAAGHDVQVLASGPSDSSYDASGVHRVRPMTHPREWLRRARRPTRDALGSASDAVDLHSVVGGGIPASTPTWKRWLLSAIWTPDDRQGFIWPAVRRATALNARAPFDVVYSSAPPFSVHLAGLLLRQRLGVPWVAEFRDPWLDGVEKAAHVRSRGMDAIERWMERRCLVTADEVVTVTHGAATSLATKRTAVDRPPPQIILSGIDSVRPSRARRPDGLIRVLHLGTLYHGRDPRPLFRALGALRRSGRLAAGTVRFEFIGGGRWFHGLSVCDMAEAAGVADCVLFGDPVPHEHVRELLDQADLLLLFAQGQPAQVPHKLYEYLGAARPILAFADAEGETAAMLRRVGGHHIVTETTAEGAVTDRIAAALRDASGGWTPNSGELEQWTTSRQMSKAVTLIERLT